MKERRRKGFTFAEIMIVVALLGILMTILFISAGSYFKKVRETQVKKDFDTIRTAIYTVMQENSGLPRVTGKYTAETGKQNYDLIVDTFNKHLADDYKLIDGVIENRKATPTVALGQEPYYSPVSDNNPEDNNGVILFKKTDP